VSGIVTDTKHHYIQKQWPKREELIPGQKTANTTLINTEKVYLPLLHIKFGLSLFSKKNPIIRIFCISG
jgi:hypothetical protein